jgi:hypothetical protein
MTVIKKNPKNYMSDKPEPPPPSEDLKPKADCPICGGKGYVECAGMRIANCTCKYK